MTVVNLIAILIFDGLSKSTRPGSLHEAEITSIFPSNWDKVPLSLGLLMAGFSGHAVFPTIYRQMKRPEQFPTLLGLSYSIALSLYILVATIGYYMFGNTSLDIITRNIWEIEEYRRTQAGAVLNAMTIWIIAVNPMTKYALYLEPISQAVQDALERKNLNYGEISRIGVRTILSFLALAVSILFPKFETVMTLLGSFFSFMVSVIFPTLCYIRLYPEIRNGKKFICWSIVILTTCLSAIGTTWVFKK